MTAQLTPDQSRLLERLGDRILASPHNLVSRRGRDELFSRHIPECVALARLLPPGANRVLDVGSGGGLPGLVVAIVRPELTVTLLEATRKKATFLRETAALLGVETRVCNQRAEDAADGDFAGAFDVVTARAVAPLARLLPWVWPLLAREGLLYAVKGERWATELDEAASLLPRLGGRVLATPDDATAPGAASEVAQPRVVIIGRAP